MTLEWIQLGREAASFTAFFNAWLSKEYQASREYSVFFVQSSYCWLWYTTIEEEEERRVIIKRMNQKEPEQKISNRAGMADTLLFSFRYFQETCGYLLIESPKKIKLTKKEQEACVQFGYFLGLFVRKQEAAYQLYCDVRTRLPGRELLCKVMAGLAEKQSKYRIGLLRFCGFSALQKRIGEKETDELLQQFAKNLADCSLGAAYHIQEPVFAILSEKQPGELMDRFRFLSTIWEAFPLQAMVIVNGACADWVTLHQCLDKEEIPGCEVISSLPNAEGEPEDASPPISIQDMEFLQWLGGIR